MKLQHLPMLQTSSIWQVLPHDPQLMRSLDVSVHTLPQHVMLNGQQTVPQQLPFSQQTPSEQHLPLEQHTEPQSAVPPTHSHVHVSGFKT